MISKENMEKKDEISEISGEDVEPPSLGEYEEQVYDENGNAMLNPDGSPLTKTVVIPSIGTSPTSTTQFPNPMTSQKRKRR